MEAAQQAEFPILPSLVDEFTPLPLNPPECVKPENTIIHYLCLKHV